MTGLFLTDEHYFPTGAHRARFTADDVDALLYGVDRTPRIVAAEFRPPNTVRLYQRAEGGQTRTIDRAFQPWLISRDPDALQNVQPTPDLSQLVGAETHPLATLAEFESWEEFRRACDLLPTQSSGVYQIASPVSQFLMRSGVTLFEDAVRGPAPPATRHRNPEPEPTGRRWRDVVMIALKQGDHENRSFWKRTSAISRCASRTPSSGSIPM
ncbi:MAG: hypothetical protein R2848_00875 [Thermomicrobiales bacterium]